MNREDCPYCEANRKAGHNYCRECGNSLDCFYCDRYRNMDAAYCSNCGRQLRFPTYVRPVKSSSLTRLLGIVSVIVTFTFLIVGAIALYAYTADIFYFLSDMENGLLILIPYPYAFMTISGKWLQMYWIFLVAVLTVSFIKLIHDAYVHFKNRKTPKGSKFEKTSIFWVGIMWPAALVLHLVIMYAFILLTGVDLTVPDMSMDKRALMFILAEASVWEELITKVLLVGIPLFVIALINRKKDCWKYLVGGFGVDKLSMGLVVIAALVFGYGHEAGWGLAKVIPAFVFGLMAGYLFLEYGLHAAIAIHFVNDYISAYTWLGGSDIILSIATLGLIGIGILATILLTVKAWRFMKSFKNRPPYPENLK